MNFQYEDTVKYSSCCNARDTLYSQDGTYYSDVGRCPACKDGCQFLTQEEMEREDV